MNLFYLDHDLTKCAQYHCKSHMTKMPLETAQLLSTAIVFYGGTTPYKPTHKNHPTCKWVRQTRSNFQWTALYGIALCEEFVKRRGKKHKSEDIIWQCADQYLLIPKGHMTPFAQAMPEQYRIPDNPVQAYRNYFCGEKQHLADWEDRPIPEWYNPNQES